MNNSPRRHFRPALVFSKMTYFSLIVIALFATATQCAVLKSEDALLTRVARSPCPTCGGPPPPPPPGFLHHPHPPLFHTHNWSGLARSSDGLQNSVFSGASAVADQGSQAEGEAFSVAGVNNVGGAAAQSSGYGVGAGAASSGYGAHGHNAQNSGQGSATFTSSKYKESQYSYNNGGSGNGFGSENLQQVKGHTGYSSGQNNYGGARHENINQRSDNLDNQALGHQQTQSNGFSSSSSAQGGSFDSNNAGSGAGSHSYRQHSGGYRGSHNAVNLQSGQEYGASSGQSGSFAASGAQSSNGGFNGKLTSYDSDKRENGGGSSFTQQNQFGSSAFNNYDSSHGSNQASSSSQNSQGYGGGASAGTQSSADLTQHQSSGSKYQQESHFGNNGQEVQSHELVNQEGSNSALKGALDLASQGLQTAQQQSACSTCGKSSYALSNAKSHSGSAIALSIGG